MNDIHGLLRHFLAALDAQAALRHKNVTTTANVYVQPVAESVQAALNARTEAVFGAANKKEGEPSSAPSETASTATTPTRPV